VGRRQVQPDLEQLERVGLVTFEQREHLGVHDAATGREPLHVATTEPRRGTERIGVVDQTLAHERHGLEATVRVLGEARDDQPVVHAPAAGAGEVHAQVAVVDRHRRREELVAWRVRVVVVGAEQERVECGPMQPELEGLQDRARHLVSLGSDRPIDWRRRSLG
jgi:hypothetical protein